jgi:hypothetical protein
VWSGVTLGVLAAVGWALTQDMPASVARYPKALLLILAVLAVLLVANARRQHPGTALPPARAGRAEVVRVGSMAATIVAYAIAFGVLGHLAATALSLPVMMRLGGERRWRWLVAVPLIAAAGLHYVFGTLLGVPLPRGWLAP